MNNVALAKLRALMQKEARVWGATSLEDVLPPSAERLHRFDVPRRYANPLAGSMPRFSAAEGYELPHSEFNPIEKLKEYSRSRPRSSGLIPVPRFGPGVFKYDPGPWSSQVFIRWDPENEEYWVSTNPRKRPWVRAEKFDAKLGPFGYNEGLRHFVEQARSGFGGYPQKLVRAMAANPELWRDPNWQATMRSSIRDTAQRRYANSLIDQMSPIGQQVEWARALLGHFNPGWGPKSQRRAARASDEELLGTQDVEGEFQRRLRGMLPIARPRPRDPELSRFKTASLHKEAVTPVVLNVPPVVTPSAVGMLGLPAVAVAGYGLNKAVYKGLVEDPTKNDKADAGYFGMGKHTDLVGPQYPGESREAWAERSKARRHQQRDWQTHHLLQNQNLENEEVAGMKKPKPPQKWYLHPYDEYVRRVQILTGAREGWKHYAHRGKVKESAAERVLDQGYNPSGSRAGNFVRAIGVPVAAAAAGPADALARVKNYLFGPPEEQEGFRTESGEPGKATAGKVPTSPPQQVTPISEEDYNALELIPIRRWYGQYAWDPQAQQYTKTYKYFRRDPRYFSLSKADVQLAKQQSKKTLMDWLARAARDETDSDRQARAYAGAKAGGSLEEDRRSLVVRNDPIGNALRQLTERQSRQNLTAMDRSALKDVKTRILESQRRGHVSNELLQEAATLV